MPNVRNQAMMDSIKADLEAAKAVWVVDACGLTVKETEALRKAKRLPKQKKKPETDESHEE